MRKLSFILAIIGLFSFSAGRLSAQDSLKKQLSADRIIAKVDNYIILLSDLEQAYQNFLSNQKTVSPNSKCMILQQLVLNKMMLAKAEEDSIEVNADEVESQMNARMQQFIEMAGGEGKLEAGLGRSIDQLKNELRLDLTDQMTSQEMQRHITKDVQVTPRQVKKYFNRIPADSIPFMASEFEVGQLVRVPKASKEIKEKLKADMREIKEMILSGKSTFDRMAKANSEDLATAAKGGNLSWFGRGQLAPEYEATALSLQEGEISDPVETDFGFHIIQLIERRANRFNTRHILMRAKPSESDKKVARHFLDSIRTRILADSLDFGLAATTLSDDRMTKANGGMFKDQQSGTNRMAGDMLDPVIYMTVDTMKVGDITPPLEFRTDDGKTALRLIYYKQKILGHPANLEQDFEKIYNVALEEEKARTTERWFFRNKNDLFIEVDPEFSNCDLFKGQ